MKKRIKRKTIDGLSLMGVALTAAGLAKISEEIIIKIVLLAGAVLFGYIGYITAR